MIVDIPQSPPYSLNQSVEMGSANAPAAEWEVWPGYLFSNDATRLEESFSEIQIGIDVEQEFNNLAKKWKEETGGSSLTIRRYAHSSYQDILVLAGRNKDEVVKLILKELQRQPDMWFEALRRITNENPAKDIKSFDGAVKSWLEWGKSKGFIS